MTSQGGRYFLYGIQKMGKKFWELAEKAISNIENLPIHPVILPLYFSLLVSFRACMEQLLFEKEFSVYQFTHHFFFCSITLMGGMLIISLIGEIELNKVSLIVAAGSFLTILPPLIDRYIFLRQTKYEYLLPSEFIQNFMTYFLSTDKAGKAIHLEITLILLLSGFYVLLKSRSLWRSVATVLSLYVFVAIVSTPRLYLPLPSLKETSLFESRHILYLIFYFAAAALLGTFFLWRLNRNFPRAFYQELRSFRTLHFLLMVGIGVYFNPALEFLRIPDTIYILIAALVMIFLWLATLLFNDVYDLKIDAISNPQRPLISGLISPVEYLNLGFCLFLLALYESLVLGVISYVIVLMIIFSGVFYSVPPLRIRNRLFHNLFIGWGSVLAFLFGYFIQADVAHLSMSGEVMMLALLIFLALSAGSVTKDLKDYEGDRRSGVKTIFTVYGLKKGMLISAVLLGLSLLTPLYLFHRLMDVLVLGSMALIIPILFAKFKQLSIAFLGYGMVFVYCVFNYFFRG